MTQRKYSELARVQQRKQQMADRTVRYYRRLAGSAIPGKSESLRITPLGGQNGIGEKNMIVLEYGDDAVILDCGFELGIDLPGINYAIPITDFLATIRHKIRGYIISHGHMDHIGALIHTVPTYPAPIFGSRFTIGMVEAQFEKQAGDYQPDYQVMDMDAHDRITLGQLIIELVRVTHSVPESSAIVIDTPAGRVINTGDFRLDPEPLDKLPSDIARLQQLGNEGVLLLMSESTNTTKPGRTPTEHTLQDSFHELIEKARGRVFVAVFSTNMNRIQMIITAAAAHGRKVALDGRSMMATAELAVRLGNLSIPKGTLVALRDAVDIPDEKLVVICTGGQGEPGAAMSRMSAGEHPHITLKQGDSVVISSTPIPGNERSYQRIGDDLAKIGVIKFRHPTHEIDGCGPLHVSGHAARDEHAEMIRLTRPTYLMPIYGGALNRQHHRQIGLGTGLSEQHILMVENGEVLELSPRSMARIAGRVPAGALLVDQSGGVVPHLVTKDRLLLQDDGFVIVTLTIDRQARYVMASPDIVTRGFIVIKDMPHLMESMRREVVRLSKCHQSGAITPDAMKHAVRDGLGEYIYRVTQQTPLIIPIITTISGRSGANRRSVS